MCTDCKDFFLKIRYSKGYIFTPVTFWVTGKNG